MSIFSVHYNSPMNLTRNIQKVRVTEDNSVVAAITLDVSVPSLFMFFAMM